MLGLDTDQTMSRPNTYKRLYVCLMPIGGISKQMWYSFKSFSIASLIGDSSSEDEDEMKFESVSFKRDPNLPFGMGFICVGDVAYGAGGRAYDKETRQVIREKIRQELSCFSLHDRSVKQKCSMHGGKVCPLLVEIGGFIYVLSGPPYDRDPREFIFEVYDPLKDEWTHSSKEPSFL